MPVSKLVRFKAELKAFTWFEFHVIEYEINHFLVGPEGFVKQHRLLDEVPPAVALDEDPKVALLQWVSKGTGFAAAVVLNHDVPFQVGSPFVVREWDDGVFGRWCADAFHVVDFGFGFEINDEVQDNGVDLPVEGFDDADAVQARCGVGMVDDRTRGGETITKVPRDEPTSVGGREEEIVENVFNDHFLVVVALVNFNQHEDVRTNRVVDSGREGRFF